MPSSNLFTTDSSKTLQNIMKNTTDSQPNQNPPAKNHNPPATKSLPNQILKKLKFDNNSKKHTNSSPIHDTNTKIDKEKLILKILKYQSNKRFGPKIKKDLGLKYTRPQLLKCSFENLESILFRIRNYLNSQNMDAVFEHMATFTAKGYEDFISNLGYDIDGFSDMLLANPSFWDQLERYKIEKEVIDIPPSFQLMYIVATTTYIAHLQNTIKQNKTHLQNEKHIKKDVKKENQTENKKKIDPPPKNFIKIGEII